jgi:transcription-repair coupling factor (superfamily II helicase)
MSATPIPRTLEMAVTGIREMSTLADAARGPASDPLVRRLAQRQADRRGDPARAAARGQVFYVHNRVQSIQRVAAQLAELVPEARIAVAHGQMGEHALEEVVDGFWERRSTCSCRRRSSRPVSTSRTRTRSSSTVPTSTASASSTSCAGASAAAERAYAYFLYDDLKPLSETAADRLETIAVNNDLGSGMQVALKDLEIRGAGNLLGAEQAGHIAGVGFDLYLRMIGEAVATFRGDEVEDPPSCGSSCPWRRASPRRTSTASGCGSRPTRSCRPRHPSVRTTTPSTSSAELEDRYGAAPADVEGLFRSRGCAAAPRRRS